MVVVMVRQFLNKLAMNFLSITTKHQKIIVAALFVSAVGLFGLSSAQAANLVNPTSPPPGGLTAEPLTTSATAQTKVGSLIFGPLAYSCTSSSNTCSQLCLNTGTLNSGACIKNWSDVSSVVNTTSVRLNASAGAAQQAGYVRLKGNNLSAYPVTSRFSGCSGGSCSGTYTALYADGLTLDNNAGYFVGRLGIEPNLGGGKGSLCLNSTFASTCQASEPGCTGALNNGYYCVDDWTDIISVISNKLTLQSLVGTPTNEQGNVGLSQTFNSAAMIVGDPNGLDISYTCGDGMCSTAETTAGTCAVDCATINPVSAISLSLSAGEVAITVTTGTASTPTVSIVVTRSVASNATFRPMNGITYARGGTTNFEVVGSATCNANSTCAFVDRTESSTNGLISGQQYYYSAWQGNAFPRYHPTAKTANILFEDGGSNPLDEPEDLPPVLP